MVFRAFLIITRTRHRHSLSSWFPIMSGTENNDLATAKSPVYHESVNRIRSIPAASRSFLVINPLWIDGTSDSQSTLSVDAFQTMILEEGKEFIIVNLW